MTRVVYTQNALDNPERAFSFFAEQDPGAAVDAAATIRSAMEILADHPLIDRRVEGEIRELVISYGKNGYVVLYRFLPERSLIRILALRHQRELDYSD